MTRARLLVVALAAVTIATLVVLWKLLAGDGHAPAAVEPAERKPEARPAIHAPDTSTRRVDPIRSRPLETSKDDAAPFLLDVPRPAPPPDDPTLPKITFRVTDRAGNPIAKARVAAGDRTGPPTGADGRTTVAIAAGVTSVVAGAPHFRIEEFALPEPRPESMTLVLARASVLVVRVRHQDGPEFVRGLRLCVEFASTRTLLAAEMASGFADVRIAAPNGSEGRLMDLGGGATTGHLTHCYDVRPGEDIVISGFKDGDDVAARIEDPHGGTLLTKTFKLVAEETAAVELVITSKPYSLRAAVVDDRDAPVDGAEVALVGNWASFGNEVRTDAEGVFEIKNVYQAEPTLSVMAEGFVPRILPWRPGTATIRVERGRDILVRLTGAALQGWNGRVEFRIDTETHGASPEGDNAFRFHSVPCRTGTIVVAGPKSEVTVSVGPSETEIEVVRPE